MFGFGQSANQVCAWVCVCVCVCACVCVYVFVFMFHVGPGRSGQRFPQASVLPHLLIPSPMTHPSLKPGRVFPHTVLFATGAQASQL